MDQETPIVHRGPGHRVDQETPIVHPRPSEASSDICSVSELVEEVLRQPSRLPIVWHAPETHIVPTCEEATMDHTRKQQGPPLDGARLELRDLYIVLS